MKDMVLASLLDTFSTEEIALLKSFLSNALSMQGRFLCCVKVNLQNEKKMGYERIDNINEIFRLGYMDGNVALKIENGDLVIDKTHSDDDIDTIYIREFTETTTFRQIHQMEMSAFTNQEEAFQYFKEYTESIADKVINHFRQTYA